MLHQIVYRENLEKAIECGDLEINDHNLTFLKNADECIEDLAESLYILNDRLHDGRENDFMKIFEEFISNRKKW